MLFNILNKIYVNKANGKVKMKMKVNVKVKSLCLTKHHATKTYCGVEVEV